MNNILEMQDVCKHYTLGASRIDVLRGVSFSIRPGEWVSLSGASGSGKTTLLHLLGLLETPDAGSITACGTGYAGLKGRRAAEFRRNRLGFIFQNYCLLPELSVLENIMLPGMLAGTAAGELEKRARDLAKKVGLARRLDHHSNELSGGEQQRAAIARALVNRPALLLADEPTGNLDRHTGEGILQLFRDLRTTDPECAILMITHDSGIAAMADRALVLADGQIQGEQHDDPNSGD